MAQYLEDSEIKKKINDMHKELYGNGSSANSLVTRVATMESSIKILTTLTVSQFFVLIGVAVKMFMGG
jgi:cell division GTPase FtsZ